MDHSPNLRLVAERRGRRVASYQTVRGAALAVKRLQQHGFSNDVAVHPNGLRPVPADVPERSSSWTGSRRTVGLAIFLLVAAGFTWAGSTPLAAIGLGLAAVWIGGAAASWREARRSVRARRAAALVRADRFDVCCEVRGDEADHLLATWWNPEAPVAERPVRS